MVNKILIRRLIAVAEAEARLRRAKALAWLFSSGALAAGLLVWCCWMFGKWPLAPAYGLGIVVFLAIAVIYGVTGRTRAELHEVARKIEHCFPEMRELLITALEQVPRDDERLSYLQDRIIREAIDHAVKENWIEKVSVRRLRWAERYAITALVAFTALMLGLMLKPRTQPGVPGAGELAAEKGAGKEYGVEVDPGDALVEKGSRLVVQARFSGELPPDAQLVVGAADGEQERIPMVKNLEDPVFGGVIPNVSQDNVYHIAYDGRRTEEFSLKTYEHPKLDRADATVTPPPILNLPEKTYEDTRSVSAVEGSEVSIEFTINKPVADGRLVGKDGWAYVLKPVDGRENTYAVSFVPEDSEQFRLHLTDADQRANKQPPLIKVNLKKNLPPQVAMVFPGRDIPVSALEEVAVEAKLWDDFGLRDFGATLKFRGEEREISLKNGGAGKDGKSLVTAMLDLEALDAKPDDSLLYYIWAEDVDAKGQVRRVSGDMYFADVRQFENLFREMEAQPGQGAGAGGGGQAQQLLEKQREIVNATWTLIRDSDRAKDEDRDVVLESQRIVAEMVESVLGRVEDAKLRLVFETAREHMQLAVDDLAEREMKQALPHEEDAYAELLKARARERNITRSQSRSQGGQGQQRQRELMELELKQKEQRYEEEKMASEENTAEQQEDLQVLNRLRELARRQEALREKIKEVQAALEEAKTEEEKEELRRQLKRLQEEQEDLLREVDDLRERMDSPENRPRMTAEREQLEKTREQVRDAARKLEEEQLSEAMNSAARAEQELKDLRDGFQRKTAKQFAQDMREMRQQARDLAENEETIRNELQQAERPGPDADTAENLESALNHRRMAESLDEQAKRAAKLMERVQEVSEDAEEPEPLVSEKLYEALRKAEMSGLEESLETARDMLEFGAVAQARKEEDKASEAIRVLKEGIEKAADRLLGDEQEALRMARSELNRLLEDLEKEGERTGDGRQAEDEGRRVENQGQRAENGERRAGDERERGEGAENRESREQEERAGMQAGGDLQRDPQQDPGRKPGQQESPPESQSQQQGQGQGGREGQQGRQQGQQRGMAQEGSEGAQSPQSSGDQPGDRRRMATGGREGDGSSGGASWAGGDDRGQWNPNRGERFGIEEPLFFEGDAGRDMREGPITGRDYGEWTDRLRDVEEMLEEPELRRLAATALDRARELRRDYQRNDQPPQWSVVQRQVAGPLMELSDRVLEELARKSKDTKLVPLDRDPVPTRYRELVRGYYEQLGSGE